MAPPTPHRGPPTGPPPPPPLPATPYGAPGHSPAPYGPAPYGAHPDNPPRNWRRWAGLAAALAATIALSATATYTLTRPAPREESAVTAPVSDSGAAAATEQLCGVFRAATKNQSDKRSGVFINGELNVANVLRALNGAVALENALSPAVPADLAAATRTYITQSLDLTTAATADETIERLTELTIAGNETAVEIADLCGIPR